jgi:hypothetical protein
LALCYARFVGVRNRKSTGTAAGSSRTRHDFHESVENRPPEFSASAERTKKLGRLARLLFTFHFLLFTYKVSTTMALNTYAAVVDALERAPQIVVPLVREVPLANLKRRPAAGKWSAHEHACHLAVVHGLFIDRLEHILATPSPVITPYDPGRDDPDDALMALDLDESLQRYMDDRARLVARLRQLSDADWKRSAEHGEYSHYSVFIMFRHLALHDLFHAYRIEELLLSKK